MGVWWLFHCVVKSCAGVSEECTVSFFRATDKPDLHLMLLHTKRTPLSQRLKNSFSHTADGGSSTFLRNVWTNLCYPHKDLHFNNSRPAVLQTYTNEVKFIVLSTECAICAGKSVASGLTVTEWLTDWHLHRILWTVSEFWNYGWPGSATEFPVVAGALQIQVSCRYMCLAGTGALQVRVPFS